jgi:hypothetical protein
MCFGFNIYSASNKLKKIARQYFKIKKIGKKILYITQTILLFISMAFVTTKQTASTCNITRHGAVNEPSEPSFWQNWLGSLVRKYIRAGPELELSLKSNAQTRLNREIIWSGSSLGSPKRDTRAEPSTRVARLNSSSGNRPQFVGQIAEPEPEPGPS